MSLLLTLMNTFSLINLILFLLTLNKSVYWVKWGAGIILSWQWKYQDKFDVVGFVFSFLSLIKKNFLLFLQVWLLLTEDTNFSELYICIYHILLLTQNFPKTNVSYSPDTHMYVGMSGGKKCYFSGNFTYVLNK